MAIHFVGDFKVEEAIKGEVAAGSKIAVDVSFSRKDETFILFLSNRGAVSRRGTAWVTSWNMDCALPASPDVVAALKQLAVALGPALETPNLYWGAETNGITARLERGRGGGSVSRLGRNIDLNITLLNRGSNDFAVAQDQLAGELEVDGVWFAGPNPTNVFDLPLHAAENQFPEVQFPISIGHQWRRETPGIDQPAGTPLTLASGTHKLCFAVTARQEPLAGSAGGALEVRAVSNPLEVEVREDNSTFRRSSPFGNAPGSPQAPTRSPFIFSSSPGSIEITGYTGSGGVVIIPDTINGRPVTSISSAFINCGTLESVKIPDTVTSIGVLAFAGCGSLESITIPDGVTNISPLAFIGCSSLTNLIIPAKVAYIGDTALAQCTGLTKILFKGNAPDTGKNVFSGDTQTTIYYLPGTTGWGTTFGGCPTALWKQ